MSAPLTEAMALKIAHELCDAAGRGNPMHGQLQHDIQNAASVAFNSPTFRRLVAQMDQQPEAE